MNFRNAARGRSAILCLLTVGLFALPVAAEASDEEVERLFGHSEPLITANILPREPVTVTAARNKGKAPKKAVAGQRDCEAELKSIEALLFRYNKRLSPQKARLYAEFVVEAGQQFQQDPFVIAAMIVNESSARHDALSRGGDYGLMQVRWRVHKRTITKKYPHITQAKDMFDPKYNVLVGTEIFSRCCAASADLQSGLLRYSAGNRRLALKIVAEVKRLEDAYQKHLKNS